MDFWHFYWHFLGLVFIQPYNIAGAVAFIVAIVLGIVVWRRPKREGRVKHLFWAVPLAIFAIFLLVGFVVAPYLAYREPFDELTKTQEDLDTCLGEHRPTVRPADSLPASTVQDTQTQETHVLIPLHIINSGDRPAYQLRIRVASTLEMATANLVVIPDSPVTNPIYPGQQITTSTIEGTVPTPIQGQVVWIYIALRYSDTANGGHCYEDEFWFAYPVGTTALASLPQDMKGNFEPLIRQHYGTGSQCQET